MASARPSLLQSEFNAWDIVEHPANKPLMFSWKGALICYDIFKLHIFIHPAYHQIAYSLLQPILYQAVENGVISSYKLLNYTKINSLTSDATMRARNLPAVLYLFNDFNLDNGRSVLLLAQKIEGVLKDAPPGDEKTLSDADVAISKHLTIRKTARDGKIEYISSHDPLLAKQLAKEVKQSDYFKLLQPNLTPIANESRAITIPTPSTLSTAVAYVGLKLPKKEEKPVNAVEDSKLLIISSPQRISPPQRKTDAGAITAHPMSPPILEIPKPFRK